MQLLERGGVAEQRLRLQQLFARWVHEICQLEVSLARTVAELERCEGESLASGAGDHFPSPTLHARRLGLQLTCDHLAQEVTHVRQALLGLTEAMAVLPEGSPAWAFATSA